MLNSLAYFLYPQDVLRPRARSNLRPLERTYGRECECGTPGALPKWVHASRALRLPCIKMVFLPVGDNRANWSKVSTSPPALMILSRARSVTLNAQMRNFGIVNVLKSFVTDPTTTAIVPSLAWRCFIKRATRCNEMTGRLMRLMKRRRKTILLNFLWVRR